MVVLVAREHRRNLESVPLQGLGPISTNLLPLPVEVHNILDIHTGMGGSLQGGLWNDAGGRRGKGQLVWGSQDDSSLTPLP